MRASIDKRYAPEVSCPAAVADFPVKNALDTLNADRICNFRDPYGNTYLHWAIQAGIELAPLKTLLNCTRDVNAVNSSGETALYRAVWYGKETLVKLLLERGADPNVATHEGLSPLMVAEENGHAAVVKALLAHGAESSHCRAVA